MSQTDEQSATTRSQRTNLTDNELLAGLATGSDEALTQLYKRYFPTVLHLVVTNSGTEDDAKDMFQETMVVLYEKVSAGSLELNCQLKTYLYSVSKRLWLKQLAGRGRSGFGGGDYMLGEWAESVETDLAEHEARDAQFDIMANSLDRLGEPCRTLLEDFYIRHLTMQDITEKFGYTNTDNAKTQKYKCLVRLKKLFFSVYKEE